MPKVKKGAGLVLKIYIMNTKIKNNERLERLVLTIGNESLPRRELIAALGLRQKARRNFCDNYLTPAIGQGYVKMQFPDIPSSPIQSYRLTANGFDLLAELQAKKEQA